jgi:hypothetical protein
MKRALLITVLCALAAALAAGCGASSGAGSADDPATVVPAAAPLYAEATLNAQGKVGDDAQAALRRILRTNDPAGKIAAELQGASEHAGLDFKQDIEPWLGDKVAAAVTSLGAAKATDHIVVIASKDDAKAAAAVGKATPGAATRSYRGVDYRFDTKRQIAAAVFDQWVVVGTEAGVKSAIDASKGDALAEANNLRDIRAKVAQDRVGLFYVDVQGLVQAVAKRASSPEVGVLLDAASAAAPKALGGALQALPDQLRVDAVSIGTPSPATPGAGGADVLANLPADSWLGLGVGDLGQTLDRLLQNISGAGGLNGLGVNVALNQFKQQTGLDLRKDVLSWMGDAGVYIAGTTSHDLRGALVVATSDPAKTKRAVTVLEGFARRSAGAHVSALRGGGFTITQPHKPPVRVVVSGGRLVVAVGPRRTIAEALGPGPKLGSTPAFTAAAGKLGDGLRPAFFVDFPQVVDLIQRSGGSKVANAKPYLESFGAAVAGAKDEGDGVTRARFVVTLR